MQTFWQASKNISHNQKEYLTLHPQLIKTTIMSTNNEELLVFDEDEAVKHILKNLPEEFKGKIKDTDIEYVLDVMVDFYEKNDLMVEDSVEEANIDEEAMFEFIYKMILKEKIIQITAEELQAILDGEFEYGKSIGIYKEDEE